MQVIITGASGFVGKNLSQYLLDKKVDIIKVSMRSTKWKREITHNAQAIIHLAGKAHDTNNTSSDDEYFRINYELTKEIYEIFIKSEIRDFFYFSSVKASADSVDGFLDEEMPAHPLTPYGKSKLLAESYLQSKALPPDKRVFIIRPCMIHGPGNKGNLNLLFKVVERGVPWPLASFRNERSFLSIDNLCFLIDSMIVNKDVKSGVYNYADDLPLSTNDLVSLIGHILGKSVRLWRISPKLIRLLVKIGDVLPLPLNSERLKKLTESYLVSNSKIKNELGIDKLPISTKDGLEKTIRSFHIEL